MKKIVIIWAICSWTALMTNAQSSGNSFGTSRSSTKDAIERLEKDIPQWMKNSEVPGLTAALIRDGKLVWTHHYGVANVDTKQPVTNATLFEAASLTKVVTAYAVLKLVDKGKISLDTPLNKYLENNYDVVNDDRINLVTARRVLTHSAGFPNWRSQDAKNLPILFTPGERFSYSGEGFVYLSKVVEKITGIKFEDFVKQTVFDPLGMKKSSFVWRDSWDSLLIYRHNWIGQKSFRWEGKESNAAASMRTTAADYARFVIALLNGEGLKKQTWNEMLTPQIKVNENKQPQVSWGLGLGLETTEAGKSFWHWGDQGDSKCYFTAMVNQKDAIIYFTNSANGLSFAKEMLADAIAGKHPALDWLDYSSYDPAAKVFYESVMIKGAITALKELSERRKNGAKPLAENIVNGIGYTLLREKKVDDAIAVFLQNTTDYPESSNTWDSLAEGYMTKGDKELAIKYYEKSLAMDPNNTNAVEQLKKLRGN